MISSIPRDLRAVQRWVTWRHAAGKKKPSGRSGPKGWERAENWLRFEEAVASGPNVGFVLGGGFSGLDLDDCLVRGRLVPIAEDILYQHAPGCYAERSPSGTGIKIYGRSALPGIELHFDGNGSPKPGKTFPPDNSYFCVTGDSINTEGLGDLTSAIGFWSNGQDGSPATKAPQGVVPRGFQHDTLVAEAGSLRRRGHDDGSTFAMLRAWADRQFDPRPSDQDIHRIVESTRGWREEEPNTFKLTESGDAEFFAEMFGADVRYDHSRRRWLRFDRTRWAPQSHGEVERLALDAVRARQAAGLRIEDPEVRKQHVAWAMRGESAGRRHRLLDLASLEAPLAEDGTGWDGDQMLLGVPNGVLDLRTGTLRPGCPEDRITMQTGTTFDPEARSELWDRVIERALPDEAVRRFLQKAAGLTLAGHAGENVLILMRGRTRTSKGTIQEAFANALGDYAVSASLGLLADREERGAPRPDLIRLRGARMVSIYESSRRLRLAPALVKTITGSDPITARDLYEKEITFKPQFLIWLATNLRPQAPNDDDALWERMREVPFDLHIPEGERDPRVRADLADPAKHGAAILAWAWRGWLAYQQEGLGQPEAVRTATQQYRGEMDPVRRYLDECCVIRTSGRPADIPWTSAGDLRRDYERFCQEEGGRRVDGRTFAAALVSVGCKPQKRANNRGWLGIGFAAGGQVEMEL